MCSVLAMNQVLLWQSALPLHSHEWRYITDALAAPRLRPLLQHGQRVKDPLPENKGELSLI
jgi:hypothetical protein